MFRSVEFWHIATLFEKSTQWQSFTAQKMKFSIKDFFSKCDQIRGFGHIY